MSGGSPEAGRQRGYVRVEALAADRSPRFLQIVQLVSKVMLTLVHGLIIEKEINEF